MRRDLLAALLVIGVAGCAIQQEQGEAWRHEMKAAAVTWQRVVKETDNPFEARRQAMLEHPAFFASSPEAARRLDMLTAIMWQLQGGEYAGAVCYMRGFQFGTAHHDQCVYEVKMEAAPASPNPRPRLPLPEGRGLARNGRHRQLWEVLSKAERFMTPASASAQ
jgi:hypothetical protein